MRAWSYRFSVALYESLFTGPDWDARRAFARQPYAWMALVFIPIAGIAIFHGVVAEYRLAKGWRELAKRRAQYEERKARSALR